MVDISNRTGLVVIWARRLIAQRPARAIVNANASTLRPRIPLFLSPGGIMDTLYIPFQLVGFALPFVTIYLLIRLVRNTERPSSRSNPWPTANELLEERFARGEISEEEYRERKRVLLEEDLRRRAEL
jgi:putative membrane protein